MTTENDLIVPVYIDTNLLLDLLASIEGGFSVVEKITTRSANTSDIDREVKADTGTEFGIPNVLNLLKINIGYSANWKKGKEEGQEKEVERYHTYGSLFYRLRAYLDNEGLIKHLDNTNAESWKTIQPSNFVEIRGLFQPNPLADSLRAIDKLFVLFMPALPQSSLKGKKKQPKPQTAANQNYSLSQIKKMIEGILVDVENEQVKTFVVSLGEYSAVTLLFADYLRDQSMTEINHREYRLLGKVVRKIDKEDGETIDLLRNTGLGVMGQEAIQQLTGVFNEQEKMRLPEVKTQISGPALEIVPIAVFI